MRSVFSSIVLGNTSEDDGSVLDPAPVSVTGPAARSVSLEVVLSVDPVVENVEVLEPSEAWTVSGRSGLDFFADEGGEEGEGGAWTMVTNVTNLVVRWYFFAK